MDSKNSLIPGSWLVDNHIDYPDTLFNNLLALDYDKSMRARWTASFGKLRFKNKIDKDNIIDYDLGNGSLFYMNDAVQLDWLHSIPKSFVVTPRISLTFRDIR